MISALKVNQYSIRKENLVELSGKWYFIQKDCKMVHSKDVAWYFYVTDVK